MKLVIPGRFPSPGFDQLQYAESKRASEKDTYILLLVALPFHSGLCPRPFLSTAFDCFSVSIAL